MRVCAVFQDFLCDALMPAPQPAEHGPSPHPPSLRTRNRHHPKRRRPVTGAGDRAATQRWYEASPQFQAQRGRPALRIRRHGGGCCSAAPPTLVNKGREARRHRRSVPKDDVTCPSSFAVACWERGGGEARSPASGATALKSSRAAAPRAGVAAAALEQRRLDELLQRREVAAALPSHRTDHRQHLGEEREQGGP